MQAGHLSSFQECDSRRCCSPCPCIPLTLGANPLQFLGRSQSYRQTHGTSQISQPAACLQRAERPQLISHLPQGPGAHPNGSRRVAALLGAPHMGPAPLARLFVMWDLCSASCPAMLGLWWAAGWKHPEKFSQCVSCLHPSHRFPKRCGQSFPTEKYDLFQHSDLGEDGAKQLKLS